MKGLSNVLLGLGLGLITITNCTYAMNHPHADNAPACAPTTEQVTQCKDVVLKSEQDVCANYYVPKSVRTKNTKLMQKCKKNRDYKAGSQ